MVSSLYAGQKKSYVDVEIGDMDFLMKFIREVQQQNGITTLVYKM